MLSKFVSRNARHDWLPAYVCLRLALRLRASPMSQALRADPCGRPEAGSAVAEPQDLRSADGVLQVDLTLFKVANGTSRQSLGRGSARFRGETDIVRPTSQKPSL
jgi:hypothetical protein